MINSLNPRVSLAARIGWTFGLLSTVLSILAGVYVGVVSRNAIERDIGALYASRAQHISDTIDVNLDVSVGAMQLAAGLLGTAGRPRGGNAERQLVDAIRLSLKDAVWIGVADLKGTIVAGDKGLLENTSLADRKWFASALVAPAASGPELVPELDKLTGAPGRGLLAVAAPMKDEDGIAIGVAVAYFGMDWIDDLWRAADSNLASIRRVDVLLFDRDGALLTPLAAGLEPPEAGLFDLIRRSTATEPRRQVSGTLVSGRYLMGYSSDGRTADIGGTGWTVVVRETLTSAYLPANQMATVIALSCIAVGIGLSVAAAMGTKLALRRLAKIAESADALRMGNVSELAEVGGRDEVARISRSLAMLFNNLKNSNFELANLNKTLDRKVNERTREVRRLSDETRSAAITRERLRLSRDLHDTLAHSMLAMLTQIRLMQKLLKAKSELLEEELRHAERAAQEGLARAREAVTELRYFAVRDDGLEQSLRKLVKRLKERVEIEISLEVDEAAAPLAGPKAETLYRVAEEALHNIEKHADASHAGIRVTLDQTNPATNMLQLIVEDDGKGFDPDAGETGHFGLLGMREQADVLGAQLAVQSSPGHGTKVQLNVSM